MAHQHVTMRPRDLGMALCAALAVAATAPHWAAGPAAAAPAQRKQGSPFDALPAGVEVLTQFGERADFSPDSRRVAFMAKSFGDAFVIDLATRAIRCLTCSLPGAAFLRVMHLASGDYLLIGPDHFEDVHLSRSRDNELWFLSARPGSRPVKLGQRMSEGAAVSKDSLKIGFAVGHAQDASLSEGTTELVVVDVDLSGPQPRLANRRVVHRSASDACNLEAQDFFDRDRQMTFTCYEPGGKASVWTLDLAHGRTVSQSAAIGFYNEVEGIFPDGRHACVESDHQSRAYGDAASFRNIDIWKLRLDGTGASFVRLTHFNDYEGWKASNPVVSGDGRLMAFQAARTADEAGVGYGLLLQQLEGANPGDAPAGAPRPLAPEVRRHVAIDAPRVVLSRVRVIDGTGAPAVEDRNVVIERGRIASIGPGAAVPPAEGQVVLERPGGTVFPGLVGMHDHLFHIARPNLRADGGSEPPLLVPQMTFSSPLLYLAAGVTTIRTTGSVEPYADLNLARAIGEGRLPGPHVDVTAPYLEGAGSPFLQMHPLRDAAEARRMVEYWADQGATSFKAYMYVTREELKAAVEAAHARGLKVTGHLCSVTYPEAAALGIDDLEHGFFVNTQLDPGKRPDECPASGGGPTLQAMDPAGDAARQLIATLVEHHVAVTSTLPVFEHRLPNRPPLQPRVLEAMSPQAREAFLLARARRATAAPDAPLADFRRAMALERAFVAAGGLLIAGPDPTGNGGTVPGFGDQRELELLVEAGFTPLEAIRIGSYNGALYLGRAERIGSLAAGRNADLVLVEGDPSKRIEDVENVELVFKDGVGYDPAKLLAAARGRYGQY